MRLYGSLFNQLPGDGPVGSLQPSTIALRCREQVGANVLSPSAPAKCGQGSSDASCILAIYALASMPTSYNSTSCVSKPVGFSSPVQEEGDCVLLSFYLRGLEYLFLFVLLKPGSVWVAARIRNCITMCCEGTPQRGTPGALASQTPSWLRLSGEGDMGADP